MASNQPSPKEREFDVAKIKSILPTYNYLKSKFF
jgi:hypothetical protein